MIFHKTYESIDLNAPPTADALEAFAAMDRFTEELVAAGVFVAAAGLKHDGLSKRIKFEGGKGTVIDGPFTESREMVVGFSIWEVKDMDEAMAWAMRAPVPKGASGEMEIKPFYEAEDLGEYVTPEELAAPPREGERGKLGVA
jgi:hypothetical protein